jgi:sigma-B regulation protein RsbU (phosphoserine phosphatase)
VPGLEAVAHYHFASLNEVGGDFYDLFALGDDRWGLFLGDVCGKGAAAATVTSMVRYTMRAAAVYDPDPATVLSTLNAALHEEYERDLGRFCTAIFGVLSRDGDGFSLTLASGGHPAPLLIRAGGASYQRMPGGPFIGVFEDAVFTASTIRLEPGDTLLLYTDGLIDARTGAARERFGDEALGAFAAGLGDGGAASVVKAIIKLLDGFSDGLDDDVAVLALSVPSGAS